MDGSLLANLIWILSLAAHVVIVVLALIFIPRDRKPTAAMAWLLLIILFPIIGILFFLLIGNFKLPKKRREEQATIDAMIKAYVATAGEAVADEATWPRWFQRVAQQNEELTALPAVGGNTASLYG